MTKDALLEELKARVKQDKDTFEHCGRTDTKGHARAIMLIDEMLKEIKDTATLSAPSPSSVGMVEKIRLGGYALNANDPDDRGPNGDDYHFTLSDSEAAALIDQMKAALLREAAERWKAEAIRQKMCQTEAVILPDMIYTAITTLPQPESGKEKA